MRTLKLAFLALVTLTFVACCKDDDEPEKGRTAVQLTSARIVESTSTDTRATDNAWEPGDAIGLVMLQAGTATPIDGKTALKYTTATAAGSFQPADEANTGYYPSEGKEADILAFYPYAQIGADLMVPVNTADQSALSRIDLMVADKSSGHSENKPGVDLSFSHKMAKLVITVTKDASAADIDLTGATLKVSGTATTAKWSLADAKLTAEGAATDITLVATTTKDNMSATGIVLPTAAEKNVKITLSTTSGHIFTLKTEDTFTLAAGKQHTLTLTVSKTALTIGSLSIAPWTETTGDGNLDWE